MVNVNVQADEGREALVNVMRNDIVLSEAAYADDMSGVYNQASNTVIAECQRGDVLWIRSYSSVTWIHGKYRRTTFSAFLMHRF